MIALRSDGCRARSPHLRLGSRRRNAGSRRQNARSRRSCREPGSSARDRAAQVHHELTRENARRQEVPAAMLPGPGPHLMRGFATDPSVTKQQLKRGTVRRIAGYARPYRWDLTIFLLAAALDAVITVTIPVLLGLVIDRGVLPKRADVVLAVAAAVAGLAIFDAFLNLVQRWYTARVGQGLTYDLRTEVFDHVQQQPIAFFTRAPTGSPVRELSRGVLGGAQGA